MKWTLLLALTIAAQAQTAKVIQLTPDEAREAETLNAALKLTQMQIADFNAQIQAKYLEYKQGANPAKNIVGWMNFKTGWPYGKFLYSEDFKYIVPDKLEVDKIRDPSNCYIWPGAAVATPAVSVPDQYRNVAPRY